VKEMKLRQLFKRFCETDLNVKLVFTSFKIKNMFSFKDLGEVVYISMIFISQFLDLKKLQSI